MAAYPSGLIPPPARWKGEARHVAVADYEPEGLDVLMRLYYPTHERPPARWRRPLWVPTLAYSHGMMHFLFDFGDPKRSWWQRLLARAAYIGGHVATTLLGVLPVPLSLLGVSQRMAVHADGTCSGISTPAIDIGKQSTTDAKARRGRYCDH